MGVYSYVYILSVDSDMREAGVVERLFFEIEREGLGVEV